MRTLIVTVAGTATRFNQDTEKETLKSLYYIDSPRHSLLVQIVEKSRGFDEIIIVGGYLHDELCRFVEEHLADYGNKIKLVYNPLYSTYGSGYSLIKGIEAVSGTDGEVVFVEGDLYFDNASYQDILRSPLDVVTANHEFILAEKAVVFYVNKLDELHYIYDTAHKELVIPEPVKAVYNSGQIWKFRSIPRLKQVVSSLTEEQMKGTNLEIVQGYLNGLTPVQVDLLPLKTWINCNTVKDYQKIHQLITDENS